MPDADLPAPLSPGDARRVPAVGAPDLPRGDLRVASVIALLTSVEVIV
jgi:hypothetical protein